MPELNTIGSFSYKNAMRSITSVYDTYPTFTDGYYVDDNGVFVEYPSYAVSGKIPVSYNDIYSIPIHEFDATDKHGAIYDENDQWIGALQIHGSIPINANYIRVNCNKGGGIEKTVVFIQKSDFSIVSNEKIVCDGDSITLGNLSNTTYPEFLGTYTKSEVVNLGVGGEKAENLYSRINSVPVGATKAVVNIGYNDYDQATSIGTISDNSTATFCGCINLIIDWYRLNRTFCELYFCNLIRSPNSPTVGGGSSLKQFSDAVVDCCKNKGIPIIDTWNCGMSFSNYFVSLQMSIGDNLHPNDFGNMKLADVVYRAIK